MAEWYYRKNGNKLGPVSTATLKGLAEDGELDPADLIWREGMVKWVKASQAKGLFGDPMIAAAPVGVAAAAARPAAAPAPPSVSSMPLPAAGQAANPLGYAGLRAGYDGSAGPGAAATTQLRPRMTVPFVIVAAIMLLLGLFIAYRSYFDSRVMMTSREVMITLAATGAFLLLCVPALVLWLLWLLGIHKDLRALSGGQYSISPGQAVGFSFIPLFDAFWVAYMPWRAARELNQHLRARGLATVPAGLVIGCQIASAVMALFLPGLVPALYAVSMLQIQSGMNRLAASQSQ